MPTHLLTRIFGECRRPAVRRVLFHPESICSDGRIGPWLMTDFFPSEGSPSPRTIGPLDSPTRLARHQLPQQDPNHFWPMLADRPFESVRAFKSIRPSNLHLPLIIRLRTHNRNPPIPRSICKHVLDSCNHFPLQSRITRILHLHRKGHRYCAAQYSFYRSSKRQLVPIRIAHVEIPLAPRRILWLRRIKSSVR